MNRPSSSHSTSRPAPASGQSRGRFGKPFLRRKKPCRFCVDKIDYIDFKNAALLRNFVTDRGKMLSARSTGVCSAHQRGLSRAIKRARNIALLPYTVV